MLPPTFVSPTVLAPRGRADTAALSSRLRVPHTAPRLPRCVRACATVERGVRFHAEGRFYRSGSAVVRDLGVLAATVARARAGGRAPRVLDACSGSGVRALRYLAEVPAGFVWANDAQTQGAEVLHGNLEGVEDVQVTTAPMSDVFREVEAGGEEACFDLVDLDVFGACTQGEIRDALRAVKKEGGMLFLSSTDAVSGAGHNDEAAQRAWGARPRAMPAANEQFLRVVVGAAAREARSLGLETRPLFCFFHRASSTARIMLRVKPDRDVVAATKQGPRPAPPRKAEIGYVSHCTSCGEKAVFEGEEHGSDSRACGACGATEDNGLVVAGAMWIGRLQNVDFLREMRACANKLRVENKEWRQAYDVIAKLIDEANEPPMYFELGDIARRIGASAPPRQRISDELARRGFSSSAVHCTPKCIKTSAPFSVVLEAARTAVEDVDAMMMVAETESASSVV